jgi:hypothetical protein
MPAYKLTTKNARNRAEAVLIVLGVLTFWGIATPMVWSLAAGLWEVGIALVSVSAGILQVLSSLLVLAITAGVITALVTLTGAQLGIPKFLNMRDRITGRITVQPEGDAATDENI